MPDRPEEYGAFRAFLMIGPTSSCANQQENRSWPAVFYSTADADRSLSFLYSDLASLRMGRSESAFFQSARNSRYLARLFSVSPACAYERAMPSRASAPHGAFATRPQWSINF